MEPTTNHYRYEVRRYSVVIDAEREEYGVSSPKLELLTFDVIRETPKGYWIDTYFGDTRWVSKTSRKRFAYPSKEEALEGFINRKKAHLKHCQSRLDRAKSDLREAQRYSPEFGGSIDSPLSRFDISIRFKDEDYL